MNVTEGRNRYGFRSRTGAMPIDGEQLEARLTSHGVYVTALERNEGTLDVEYESIDAGRIGEVPHQEMGRVINIYRELVDEERKGDAKKDEYARIEATVTDLEGDPVGRWHAEADWLRALAADDLSEVDFSTRVLETIDHDIDG